MPSGTFFFTCLCIVAVVVGVILLIVYLPKMTQPASVAPTKTDVMTETSVTTETMTATSTSTDVGDQVPFDKLSPEVREHILATFDEMVDDKGQESGSPLTFRVMTEPCPHKYVISEKPQLARSLQRPSAMHRPKPAAAVGGGQAVILIPGLGGNKLAASGRKTSKPAWYCDWNISSDAWIGIGIFKPHGLGYECWTDTCAMTYSASTKRILNKTNLTIEPPSFGSTYSMHTLLDILGLDIWLASYLGPLIDRLTDEGYEDGWSMFGAPYDWRAIIDDGKMNEYVNNLTNLVKTAYANTGGKKVKIYAHSMGGKLIHYIMVDRWSQSFKDQYIEKLIVSGGAMGGAPKMIRTLLSGYSPVPTVSNADLAPVMRTCGAFTWLKPIESVYSGDAVTIGGAKFNYSDEHFDDTFQLTGFTDMSKVFNDLAKNKMVDLQHPGVKTHIIRPRLTTNEAGITGEGTECSYVYPAMCNNPAIGQSWIKVAGTLTQLSSNENNVLWGVDGTQRVWRRRNITSSNKTGENWDRVGGTLNNISVGSLNGATVVWGANNDGVWRRTNITSSNPAGSGWSKVDYSAGWKQASVGPNGEAWAIKTNNNIYRRTGITSSNLNGTGWTLVKGGLVQISVGSLQGTPVVVGTTNKNKIFRRKNISASNPTGTGWQQIGTNAIQISAGATGQMVYLQKDSLYIWRRACVTPSTPHGTAWDQAPGSSTQISANPSGSTWAIGKNSDVFYMSSSVSDTEEMPLSNPSVTNGESVVYDAMRAAGDTFLQGKSNSTTRGDGTVPYLSLTIPTRFWTQDAKNAQYPVTETVLSGSDMGHNGHMETTAFLNLMATQLGPPPTRG